MGYKKLQISCVVEDEKFGTDFLEEYIIRLRVMCSRLTLPLSTKCSSFVYDLYVLCILHE